MQLGEIGAAVAQLDLQGEAAGVANALDRRRREGGDIRIDGGERRRHAVEQGEQVFALAPGLENHIGDAGVGQCGAVVEGGDAGNAHDLIDARVFAGDRRDLVERLLGAAQRGAVRQLNGHER